MRVHIQSKFTNESEETTPQTAHSSSNSIVIYITENQILNFTLIKFNKAQGWL